MFGKGLKRHLPTLNDDFVVVFIPWFDQTLPPKTTGNIFG